MDRPERSLMALSLACYLAVFGAGGVAMMFIVHLLFPHPVPDQRVAVMAAVIVASVIMTALAVGVGVWVIYRAVHLPVSPVLSFTLALVLGATWFGLVTVVGSKHYAALAHASIALRFGTPFFEAVSTLCLALACAFLGRFIANVFKDKNLVAVAAVVGGLVDFWGVNSSVGTTHTVLIHHPEVVRRLSVSIPSMLPMVQQIGPGDYAFIGILLALVCRFDLNPGRTAKVMYLLVVAALLLVMVTGIPIPGVVAIGAAVLVSNWREFHFKKSELLALVYVGILLAGLAFVLSLLFGRHGLHL